MRRADQHGNISSFYLSWSVGIYAGLFSSCRSWAIFSRFMPLFSVHVFDYSCTARELMTPNYSQVHKSSYTSTHSIYVSQIRDAEPSHFSPSAIFAQFFSFLYSERLFPRISSPVGLRKTSFNSLLCTLWHLMWEPVLKRGQRSISSDFATVGFYFVGNFSNNTSQLAKSKSY